MVIPYKHHRQHADDDLVRLAQFEDSAAFDELVRRYKQRVYGLTYKILRHEEDAAEALQDTFLSAYRGLKNFKAEAMFSTWLYRIAANASLMKLRKRRLNHFSLEQSRTWEEEDEPLDIKDPDRLPLEALLDHETRDVLADGFRQLPADLGRVFALRDLEERSNAEVAEMMGLTIAAVKSRLHRARLFLRNRLGRYFEERLSREDLEYA
jgi:RNA polymerase sigma-70 factor (ECF subfamily)